MLNKTITCLILRVQRIIFSDRYLQPLINKSFQHFEHLLILNRNITIRHTMTNHQTGKATDLVFSDYAFSAGLADKDFVKGVLKRIR